MLKRIYRQGQQKTPIINKIIKERKYEFDTVIDFLKIVEKQMIAIMLFTLMIYSINPIIGDYVKIEKEVIVAMIIAYSAILGTNVIGKYLQGR